MRVYVAGPISQGDRSVNIRNGITAGDRILKAGHTPFIPFLSHFHDLMFPNEYEVWLRYDFDWLRVCEALVRIPGPSSGADREVALATSLGIPVYYSVDDFLQADFLDATPLIVEKPSTRQQEL